MKDLLIGKQVVVRGLYSGTYFGTVVGLSDDFRVIHLQDAIQIRKCITSDTSGGLAQVFEGNFVEMPDFERIVYNNGDIFLTENYEIIPLSEKAISNIKKHAH